MKIFGGERRFGAWAATARTALLFALPLLFAALLGAQWLDADYIEARDGARRETARRAMALGDSAGASVVAMTHSALDVVDHAAAEGFDPPSHLWRVVYGYDLGLLILIRRGGQQLFPPENPLALPKMWEERLRALTQMAEIQRDGDFVNGWFPNISGAYYFECRRAGQGAEREEKCVALSNAQLFPALTAAADDVARTAPGWAFRLRDPFERIVWSRGEPGDAAEVFMQGGSLRGWTLEASGPVLPRQGVLGRLALFAPLLVVWLLLVWQAHRAQKLRLAAAAARAAMAERLSHDLRTPLANLKLYAELIARKAGAAPDLARYCDVMTQEIDRLDALAGETLRTGGASQDEGWKRADPGEVARGIVARYETLLAASGAHCEVTCCEVTCAAGPLLRFDVAAFERVLINLIDNARKYAPGRIDVEIFREAGLLGLSVRDYGGGNGERPAPKSHGLGLSIVQELARANGGVFSLAGAEPGLRARATLRAESA